MSAAQPVPGPASGAPGAADGAEPDATAGEAAPAGEAQLRTADIRLARGHLSDDELAAIAVVVSTMSVTSRLEAEERGLAEGRGAGAGAWTDPVHCHPRGHALRHHASATAWQFSDR